MTKRDDALAALRDIRRAIFQSRDNANTMIGRMIKEIEDGGDLKPLPAPAPRVRTPMAPMATGPKPAPTPVPEKEPEPEPDAGDEETADDGVAEDPDGHKAPEAA